MKTKIKNFVLSHKLIAAIILLTESATLLVYFLIKAISKKDVAAAILATSILSGALGTTLLIQALISQSGRRISAKQEKEMLDHPHTFSIPTDEKASEKEFQNV